MTDDTRRLRCVQRPAIPAFKIWHVEGLGEMIHGPVSQPLPRAVHDNLVIGLMETGTVKALYRGVSHTLRRGAIILGQPDEGIAFDPVLSEPVPVRACLGIPATTVRKVSSQIAGRQTTDPFFPSFVTPDPALAALFLTFERSLRTAEGRLEVSSRFHEMLSWIVSRHATPPPSTVPIRRERVAVRRVREYLDAHYRDNIDLDVLARLVSLSPFYLSRVFRVEVGLPPHAYQTQLRASRGKDLLAQGIAIDRVAVHMGFFDQSHFTRHFKRLFGFTPGIYQDSLQRPRARTSKRKTRGEG